jgi:hypothetical protein
MTKQDPADFASDKDAKFFKRNPDRNAYIRRAIPGEFAPPPDSVPRPINMTMGDAVIQHAQIAAAAEAERVEKLPPNVKRYTVVGQAKPGVRFRIGFTYTKLKLEGITDEMSQQLFCVLAPDNMLKMMDALAKED